MIELAGVGLDSPGRTAPILDHVDFALAPGARAVLLGGNGSGKTTLARLLNGSLVPSRGRVLVDGRDTRDPQARIEVRRAVGLLFQDPDDQLTTTSVEREIAFGLENLRVAPAELRREVEAALRLFDLEDHRHAVPHELSGGEKTRLALAGVWVMRPRYLVLDETESLLDRRGREGLEAALASLPAGTAVLRVTSHAEAAAEAARLVVLHEGRIVADGTPDEVFPRLPAEVGLRTGWPRVWRISRRLAESGRIPAPTLSVEKLERALGVGAGAKVGRAAVDDDTPTGGGGAAAVEAGAARPETGAALGGTPARGEPWLRASAVDFAYGDRPTLDSVSFEVRAGDRVGLLGASGSGKTTLLHLMAGLLRPRRGRLEGLAGGAGMPSLVFQFAERQLFAETVRRDVAYGLGESGVGAAEIERRVGAALEDVGLDPATFAEREPFHLSGGEMRRVALAGALAQERPVVLLDEPTLGLDADGVARLRAILERIHGRGRAYWVASHDADFVVACCDRVLVLDAGRVAFEGPVREFWDDPRRAARLGIESPRALALASRLGSCAAPIDGL